jgi:hypothetical protein
MSFSWNFTERKRTAKGEIIIERTKLNKNPEGVAYSKKGDQTAFMCLFISSIIMSSPEHLRAINEVAQPDEFELTNLKQIKQTPKG